MCSCRPSHHDSLIISTYEISAFNTSFQPWRGVFGTHLFDKLDKVWESPAYVLIIEWIVWGYQRGSQILQIEEGQTTQWPNEKTTKGQTTIYKKNLRRNQEKSEEEQTIQKKRSKQWWIKHYIENERSNNTNPTKHQVWSQVIQVLIIGAISWDENIFE
jgi:hypothetical protein